VVIKKKKQSTTDKRGKAKISGMKLNKETVKELTDSETQSAKGGLRRRGVADDTTEQGCVSLGCMTRISSVGNGCCS
jgi:hypothetical protein